MNNNNVSTPIVGMPITLNNGSDCYPGEVVEVKGAKTIIVRKASNRFVKEFKARTYTLRNNGEWVRKGKPATSSMTLTLGVANESFDMSF